MGNTGATGKLRCWQDGEIMSEIAAAIAAGFQAIIESNPAGMAK
jgi:hypothetical protein